MFELFDDFGLTLPDYADSDDWGVDDSLGIEPDLDDSRFDLVESDSPVVDESQGWFGNPDVLTASDFYADGAFDGVNNCVVEGLALEDLELVDQQTHGSCSLMAQEQFVERWIGENVPEHVLEEIAEGWGVYTPDGGTNFAGQDALLDWYGVPHQRYPSADITMLEQAIANGNDAILSVDAREFYGDATVPPNSGHAVSVVGRGIDPGTQETIGFYFTDSNYPGTARFLTVDELTDCWSSDMIVVNTNQPATGMV